MSNMDQVLCEMEPEMTRRMSKKEKLQDDVMKFGQSLKAVTGLEGLLKAKSCFLTFINREDLRIYRFIGMIKITGRRRARRS